MCGSGSKQRLGSAKSWEAGLAQNERRFTISVQVFCLYWHSFLDLLLARELVRDARGRGE